MTSNAANSGKMMSIRTEPLALASPITYVPYGADRKVAYANHRAGLRPLQHIWNAMMALLSYPIPDTTEISTWAGKTLLEGLEIAKQLYNAHHFSCDAKTQLFHPFFIALHDEQVIAANKTLSPIMTDEVQRRQAKRGGYRCEIIHFLSTIKKTLIKNYNAAYNYEDSIRERRCTVTDWKERLAKMHKSVYVLRVMLQTPRPGSVDDMLVSRKRICEALSRRQKICKDKLGYFWSISCDTDTNNRPVYHMALTVVFPATSATNQEQYQQEVKRVWRGEESEETTLRCLGYPSRLHKTQPSHDDRQQIGDVIDFNDPQHTDAINRMLEEYYLEQLFVKVNHSAKTAGISFLKT